MLCSLPRLRSVVEISYGCMGRSARQPSTASASGLETRRRYIRAENTLHGIFAQEHVPLRGGLEVARELHARPDLELRVDVAQVGLDSAGAEDELLGDLAVRAAGADELGDLPLADGEGVG